MAGEVRLKKGMALAGHLDRSIGRAYTNKAVQAWMRGEAMPPADVFLAVIKAAGISIDESLGIGVEATESVALQLEQLRVSVKALESGLATQMAAIERLYTALGIMDDGLVSRPVADDDGWLARLERQVGELERRVDAGAEGLPTETAGSGAP